MRVDEEGRGAAVRVVLRYYWRELWRLRRLSLPGLIFPALGSTVMMYVAPLVVAMLVGRLAAGGADAGSLVPYVVAYCLSMLVAEGCWRVGFHLLNRVDGRGMERLAVVAMDELLAKDAAFFHDNFAGALTKRVIGFASRYEDFVDTLAFQVLAKVVPLGFACVVLWRYDPLLVVVLVGLIVATGFAVLPLIRRRQALVDRREAASVRVSGHVADTLTNMDTVRAFAAERREALEHRGRVAELRRHSILSWDYANLRIDPIVAGMSVVANAVGLLVAVLVTDGTLGVEALIVTFTYFTNATRIMFEFNQVFRRLESSITEAAQFTELLTEPPRVVDPVDPCRRARGPTSGSRGSSSRTWARRRCSRGWTWRCRRARGSGWSAGPAAARAR